MEMFLHRRRGPLQWSMRATCSFDHESLQARLKNDSLIVSFVTEGNLRRPTRPRREQSPRPAQLLWSAHSPPPRRRSACRWSGRNTSRPGRSPVGVARPWTGRSISRAWVPTCLMRCTQPNPRTRKPEKSFVRYTVASVYGGRRGVNS